MNDTVITKHRIDKVTYIVVASHSENAKDTLHQKIDKLILRDMKNSEYADI
jgi:hypothetical protein